MFNEAPNNSDITCVENMVLNEAPNSNDAMYAVNNVQLTTKGAQRF